jgi:hypothetical protein
VIDLDINTLFREGVITVNNEHPDEREIRLRIQEADATAVRLRENIKFTCFSILLVAFIGGSAYYALTSTKLEIQQWCLATLTTIVSGSIGYLVGERKSSTNK